MSLRQYSLDGFPSGFTRTRVRVFNQSGDFQGLGSANYILIEEGFACKVGGALIQGEKKTGYAEIYTELDLVELVFK